jgi:hypothetical protein
MNKEQLLAALAAGTITQEEFNAKLAELEKGGNDTLDFTKLAENPEFQKYLNLEKQREADRVRSEYVKKLTDKDTEINSYKAKTMTADELYNEKLQELEAAKQELHNEKLNLETLKLLDEHKIDAKFSSFVTGNDIETRKASLEAFKALLEEQVAIKTSEKFKGQGREYETGDDKTVVKKWNEMSIDEKIALNDKEPEKAERLMKESQQ